MSTPPPPDPTTASLRITELEHALQRLTFARDATREFMGSSESVKKVVEVIFQRMLHVLEAEAGSLWLVDAKSGQNICHLAEGPAKKRMVGTRLAPGEGIVGKVIATQRAEVVLDCTQDPRFASQVDERTGFRTLSMMCVPLADQGQAHGAIQILNKRSNSSHQFSEEDLALLQDLALSAGVAMRNARLLETESRVKEMGTLLELSRQLVSSLDLDNVLKMTAAMAGELVAVRVAAVALLDEHQDRLRLAVFSDGRKVDLDDPRQQQMLVLMEQVRKARRTSYVGDVAAFHKQQEGRANGWVSYLKEGELTAAWSTPLTDEEGVLGVLWLESDTPGFAPKAKAEILYLLANQATVALRNASLYQRIPFAHALAKVGDKGRQWMLGWRQRVLLSALAASVLIGLHYIPVFRTVSGDCLVEARLGRGVFLPLAGRIKAVAVTEGQRVRAGETLLRLDDAPMRLKRLEAETRLALLERQIVEAQAGGLSVELNRALIERAAVRAEVNQARDDLARVEVRAEADGLVLTPRVEELVGREFPIGAEALRLADPERLTVVVNVPEEDVLDIQRGQEVHGVLRSRPGWGFQGVVRHVGQAYAMPALALDPGVAEPVPPQGFVAEVTVVASDLPLRPGMTGQAAIATPETSVITRLLRRVVNALALRFPW